MVAQYDDITSTSTRAIDGNAFQVIMRRGHRMDVKFQDTTFHVEFLRSQRDVDDVLQMLMTYRFEGFGKMSERMRKAQKRPARE